MSLTIPTKLLHPNAKIPARAKAGDAAYDLFAVEDVTLFLGERVVIKTGVALCIPQGYYGRIAERSGLALKEGLMVGGGVIDSGYRGELGVIAFNMATEGVITIHAGDRIAQLIIERCYDAHFPLWDELPESERGAAGYGSTS